MNKFFGLIATVLLVTGFSNCAKFPANVQQCRAGDNSCLSNVISDVLKNSADGNQGLNLVPIDPLNIKEMSLAQNANSPVNIQLKFKDSKMIGISKAVVHKTVGFDPEAQTTVLEMYGKIPSFQFVGPYEIKGSVLILPITGSGFSNLTFDNVDVSIKLIPKVIEKKGKTHLDIQKVKLAFTTTRLHIRLDNLFNGDKALGDNMNQFMNENWQDILTELKPAIVDALQEVFLQVVKGPFNKIPYEQLYLE